MKNKIPNTSIKNVFNVDKTFHIHTPKFLTEVVENSRQRMYKPAWDIFFDGLRMIAQRATELHDPVLDAIMLCMTMYEFDNKDYTSLIAKCEEIYNQNIKK